jgi:hypothetical protein
MPSRKCAVCGASVNAENLPNHLRSVHPRETTPEMVREAKQAESEVSRTPKPRPRSLRTRPSWGVPAAILVILLVIGGVWFVSTQSASPYNASTPVTAMCMQDSTPLARHDHVLLSITILGAAQPIPDSIGITPQCMRPLHTHAGEPGRIHIESPVPHEFTLADFFIVWSETGGRPFNQNTIMGYNTSPTYVIVMTVDGVQSSAYENHVLPHGTVPTVVISYQAR